MNIAQYYSGTPSPTSTRMARSLRTHATPSRIPRNPPRPSEAVRSSRQMPTGRRSAQYRTIAHSLCQQRRTRRITVQERRRRSGRRKISAHNTSYSVHESYVADQNYCTEMIALDVPSARTNRHWVLRDGYEEYWLPQSDIATAQTHCSAMREANSRQSRTLTYCMLPTSFFSSSLHYCTFLVIRPALRGSIARSITHSRPTQCIAMAFCGLLFHRNWRA